MDGKNYLGTYQRKKTIHKKIKKQQEDTKDGFLNNLELGQQPHH